jgi:hypothetical protein
MTIKEDQTANQPHKPNNSKEDILTRITKFLYALVAISLTFGVGFFLYRSISGDAILIGKLGDPAFARGLITFLITVSTIGLAFFMAIKAFSTASSVQEKEEADNKYRRAREIFASLMGILGTIVGFYFGSAEKVSPLLNIADIQIIDKTIVSNITGGTEPYRYTITPSSDAKGENDHKLNPILDQISPDGWIKVKYDEKPKSGTLTIVVTDSKNASASKTKEIKSTESLATDNKNASTPTTKEIKSTAVAPNDKTNADQNIAPNEKKQ